MEDVVMLNLLSGGLFNPMKKMDREVKLFNLKIS